MSHSTVYRPLRPAARRQLGVRLARHFVERDGHADIEAGTLEHREAWFSRLAEDPVRYPHEVVSQEHFTRYLRGGTPATAGRFLNWLMILGRLNASEAYGVSIDQARWAKHPPCSGDPKVYVNFEEAVHTRIFKEILAIFGLEWEVEPPAMLTRLGIHAMLAMPDALRSAIILTAEVGACRVLTVLIEEAGQLLADHPRVRDRVQMMLREVLVDELAHVQFVRQRIPAPALWLARLVSRSVLRGFALDVPELTRLPGIPAASSLVADLDLDALLRRHLDTLRVDASAERPALPSSRTLDLRVE